MKLQPEVEEFLRDVRSSDQHMSQMGVDASRRLSREQEVQYAWDPGVKVDVRDATVPVEGASIAVRTYTPQGALDDGAARLPILIWIHGGGWVIGSAKSLDADALCRYLSAAVGCLVVSVDYRLSPENRFPVPAEDSYAALEWVVENSAELHGDAKMIALAGDSAGGNLVAVVCLMARDRGGPAIAFQMPIYPATDFATDTESYRLYGRGYGLDTEDMLWFWKQYLRTDEDGTDQYASPLRAKDFRGLPPAFVMTAGLDPLRDEGEAYGEKLRGAGVPTMIMRVEGMPHGFITLPFGSKGREIAAAELRSVFAGGWQQQQQQPSA